MASSAVGIDIGTRAVTLAEVTSVRGAPTITNFGGVDLPEDAVREGEVLDARAVQAALHELLELTGVRTKKVHIGVANQRVVVRQVDLPWAERADLASGLRFQVQEHLPIPVEEAELDLHVVDEFTTDEGERRLRGLLVGAHRDMVASHVDAVTGAKLKPVSVDLNPFATLRAIGDTGPRERGSEVVVDIGAGVTEIVVHDAGIPSFVRILVLGGDDITDALATGVGTSRPEAEQRKRDLGIGRDTTDVATRIVNERAGAFVDEVRSSLDYHLGRSDTSRLDRVILTGGGASLRGLPDLLAAAVHLPVEVGSVFDRWPVKGTTHGPDDLRLVGPNLAVAVGLAIGGLG